MLRTTFRLGSRSLKASTLFQPVLPAMVRPSIAMTAPQTSFGTLSTVLTAPASMETKAHNSIPKTMLTPIQDRVGKHFFSTSSHDSVREQSKEEKIVKSVIDPNHPFRSLLRIVWKNIRSGLPVSTNTIRRMNKEENWWMIAAETNRCQKIIARKIDPELGTIAKSIVAGAKHLASLDRNGALSTVQSDRIFNEELRDLLHLWGKRLETLLEKKVINESALNDPHGDDIAVYNVNLIFSKYYSYINKIIEKENTDLRQPYILPIEKSNEFIEISLKESHSSNGGVRGESKEEKNLFSLHQVTQKSLQESKDSSTTIKETGGYTPKIQPKHKLYYAKPTRKVKFLDKSHERFIDLDINDNEQNAVEKNDHHDTLKAEQANSEVFLNKGYVPEFTSAISQEQLNKINKASESSSAPPIKWEFDPYRSLYYFRTLKSNPDAERNKQEQRPSKETDHMVVFSCSRSSNKK